MASHDHAHLRHQRKAFAPHHPFAERDMSTVVSVVYVTQSATFSGAIAGYTTLGVAIDTTTQDSLPAPAASTSSPVAAVVPSSHQAQSQGSASTAPHTTLSTSTLPSSIMSPTMSFDSTLAIVAATGEVSTSQTIQVASTSSVNDAASTASSTVEASSPNSGMSVAGKAGLAIGILLIFGAILSLVLFCFKKRREAAQQERFEDEKHEFANIDRRASTRTTATTATAPRLSLRPVTQFLPNLTVKRASRGDALLTVTEDGQKWDLDRPTTATSQADNQENPFGNHAETISHIDATNADGAQVVDEVSAKVEITEDDAVVVAEPGLKRGASIRGNAPSPLDFTKSGPFMGPPSPAGTEFSVSSETATTPTQTGTGVAIAVAGGPANSAVHRVQLDFKPSMEDELELRAGQLIRLLHEYDDGWALCIRLDRSRQGVVPRTCLSTRPVKPRPQQNGPRGGSPKMRGPQLSPVGQGSPRPMTPTGPLPSTPTSAGRNRSPSVANTQSRPNSPRGPSPMKAGYVDSSGSPQPPPALVERKPVPGQAL